MKRILLLLLVLVNEAHAITILSERSWCSEGTSGHAHKIEYSNGLMTSSDNANAKVILPEQFGYQGLENTISSTHTFYVKNNDGITNHYTFRARLCDVRNKCVNYEKKISLSWQQYYSETIYLNLISSSINIGRELIYGETISEGYPYARDYKESSFILKPFPYDG